jgi:xanthine/uracil/vitamin C permease (AzgA family)
VSYQTALAAVFVEGWIFIVLALTGLRLRLIRLVPKSIMLATSAGQPVLLVKDAQLIYPHPRNAYGSLFIVC